MDHVATVSNHIQNKKGVATIIKDCHGEVVCVEPFNKGLDHVDFAVLWCRRHSHPCGSDVSFFCSKNFFGFFGFESVAFRSYCSTSCITWSSTTGHYDLQPRQVRCSLCTRKMNKHVEKETVLGGEITATSDGNLVACVHPVVSGVGL